MRGRKFTKKLEAYYPIWVSPELKYALNRMGSKRIREILTTAARSHFHVKKLELIPRRLAEAEQAKAAGGVKLQIQGFGHVLGKPACEPWGKPEVVALKKSVESQTIP